MFRSIHAVLPPRVALIVAMLAMSACATAPPATASSAAARVVGQQATIEGDVVSVDTAPWAYDGNAVVTVSTASAGTVRVQLPARWNLCKAQPPGDVQALKPGDRVQAIGTVTAPDTLVVCEQPQHTLRKVE
jgi:acid phosphatase class B